MGRKRDTFALARGAGGAVHGGGRRWWQRVAAEVVLPVTSALTLDRSGGVGGIVWRTVNLVLSAAGPHLFIYAA